MNYKEAHKRLVNLGVHPTDAVMMLKIAIVNGSYKGNGVSVSCEEDWSFTVKEVHAHKP
jgi:hypothetical protein